MMPGRDLEKKEKKGRRLDEKKKRPVARLQKKRKPGKSGLKNMLKL